MAVCRVGVVSTHDAGLAFKLVIEAKTCVLTFS